MQTLASIEAAQAKLKQLKTKLKKRDKLDAEIKALEAEISE